MNNNLCGKRSERLLLDVSPSAVPAGQPYSGGRRPEAMHSQALRGHRASLLFWSRVTHQVGLSSLMSTWVFLKRWQGGAPAYPPSGADTPALSWQQLCDACLPPQELYDAGRLREAATGLDQSCPEQHRHRLPRQGRWQWGKNPHIHQKAKIQSLLTQN